MEYSRLLIERFLVKGSVEELDSFIGFYFSEIPEEHFQSLLMRQYLSGDIFITINSFYKQNGIDRIKEQYIEKFIERIQRAHTLEQMKVILHDMLADTLERRQRGERKQIYAYYRDPPKNMWKNIICQKIYL